MLGLTLTSWMRFFAFGLIAGVLLSFVRYEPISILGRVDTIAAFCGLVLVTIYMRSYKPWTWRRLIVRIRRLIVRMRPHRRPIPDSMSMRVGTDRGPLLSP